MAFFFPLTILAAGGLTFAFEHATVAAKVVLALLLIGSIFSWSVMITKMRVVQFARKQTVQFRKAFRKDRQPLRLLRATRTFRVRRSIMFTAPGVRR